MIRALWLLLAVLPATAQFLDLIAPGHGDDLYYALGAGPVYKVGSASATLFAWSSPPVFPPNGISNTNEPWYISPYFRISHPQFSRDGAVSAFLGRRDCLGGLGCSSVTTTQTTVHGVSGRSELTFPGKGWLSGNGRYLLLQADASPSVSPQAVWVDLQTGIQQTLPLAADFSNPSATGRVIADDGTAVFANLFFLLGTQFAQPFPTVAAEPVIDAAAQTVVYTAVGAARYLRVYHIASNLDAPLAQANGDTYSPSLSSDGRRVLFLSTAQWGTNQPPGLAQLYAVNIDGTGFQELTSGNEPTGVQRYAASDDAQVAWYLAGDGKLVKLDLSSGRIGRTIVRVAPVDLSPTLVPGSAVTFPASPLPSDVSVTLNGIHAPLLSVDTKGVTVQVPWELSAGLPAPVQIVTGAGTTMEASVQAIVTPAASRPALLAALAFPGDYGGQAIHQDWSGYVTQFRPAVGGEIVHLFGTGFGPVQPVVATGIPAPANPPAVVPALPACTGNGLASKVLYLGLAPGTAGYYQLDVQLPATFSATHPLENKTYDQMYLDCGAGVIAVLAIRPNSP